MNSRLISLDFFRGLTIAAMIVVNDPGRRKDEGEVRQDLEVALIGQANSQ